MAGLAQCTALVELYLSHNGIWALDSGLTQLTQLKVRL
jgi:ABC-type transport system involved in cytochrome c biogenesis ATPase subunit